MSEQVTTPEGAPAAEAKADEPLGTAGLKALQEEREARATAEKKATELEARLQAIEQEKLSDLEKANLAAQQATEEAEKLRADLTQRDVDLLRQKVGAESKLPPELIARLQGDDEESLRSDAKKLAELVPDNPSPFPKADPSQGGRGTVPNESTANKFAAFMESKLS